MAIAYEPGDEICLDINGRRKFFAKAKSWKEQKAFTARLGELETLKQDEQPDAALKMVVGQLTRIEPEMEITTEALSEVLDRAAIFDLVVALKFNLTFEEKKSSE